MRTDLNQGIVPSMVQPSDGGNRRKYERWEPLTEVRATLVVGDCALTGRVLNLSEAGLCVVLPAPLADGCEGALTLEGADLAAPVRLAAAIVWSQAVGAQWVVGVTFRGRLDRPPAHE
jgi:hypothetical protein